MKLYEVEIGKNSYVSCGYEKARQYLKDGKKVIDMDTSKEVTEIPVDETIHQTQNARASVITRKRTER